MCNDQQSQPKEINIKFLDLREVKSVIELVDNIVGLKVIQGLKRKEIEWCYTDDLSWLPD